MLYSYNICMIWFTWHIESYVIGNNPREIHTQFTNEETESKTEITYFFMATFIYVIPLSDVMITITVFCSVKRNLM